MNHLDYLINSLKTNTGLSEIDGVGTFAIRDIKKGEKIFERWKGDTRVYVLTFEQFKNLPLESQKMIYESYVQDLEQHAGFIWFRLFKDCYFNLANPWRYVNTAEENGNICSIERIAVRDIKKGEEILSNYKLEDTLKWRELI